MKKTRLGLLVLVLVMMSVLMLSSIAVAQDNTTLTAARVEAAISDPLDAGWSDIPALTVALLPQVEDPNIVNGLLYEYVPEVSLQAVYTDDTIYVRAVWADNTMNDNRRFWMYDGAAWVRSSLNEDRLSLMFDITGNRQFTTLGCGAVCHTATDTMPAFMGFAPDSTDAVDMWHWKAARTGGAGYADDQWAGAFVDDPDEPTGRGNDSKDSGGYSDNVNEAGDGPAFTYADRAAAYGPLSPNNAVEVTSDMTFAFGDIAPYYIQVRPVGSRGDISASARYVRAEDGSGMWYVVMSRAFNTGNPEDTMLALNSENIFGVAVFNQAGGEKHSVSENKLILAIGE